jgi:glycosyltransferase involved in cell wall biosynthesis
MNHAISVIIASKDRFDDLCRAINSCLRLNDKIEVIVLDDGSNDSRYLELNKLFSSINVIRDGNSKGYIVRRNEGAELARFPIIVSIDDDAELLDVDIARKLHMYFEDKAVAAVTLPYIDLNQGPKVKQAFSVGKNSRVAYTYVGTAHALRRDIFLELGGYRTELVHQGEERDYSIRLMNIGYKIVAGDLVPLHHYESPVRSYERMDYYGRRNDIVFHYQNIPLPYVIWTLPKVILGGLIHCIRVRRFFSMIRGMFSGVTECFFFLKHTRDPVKKSTYREFVRLRKLAIKAL